MPSQQPPGPLAAPTTLLPALARTIAQYVEGVGHVYDQIEADPTPDDVKLMTDGKPVVIFVDPSDIEYDANPRTMGMGAETRDTSTIKCVFLYGSLDQRKAGALQGYARPFARYLVKDAIRQHNTLFGVVWRARVARSTSGKFEWGGFNYYATQFTIVVDEDRDVTPGS